SGVFEGAQVQSSDRNQPRVQGSVSNRASGGCKRHCRHQADELPGQADHVESRPPGGAAVRLSRLSVWGAVVAIPIPFVGPAYTLDSLAISCQRCLNWYPEVTAFDSKTQVAQKPRA